MSIDAATLLGPWRKLQGPACAAQYPDHLRFEANGLYTGTTEPPGEYTLWDVGTWRIAGAELAISTANDAVIGYACSLSDGVLRLSDPDGCQFSYSREE